MWGKNKEKNITYRGLHEVGDGAILGILLRRIGEDAATGRASPAPAKSMLRAGRAKIGHGGGDRIRASGGIGRRHGGRAGGESLSGERGASDCGRCSVGVERILHGVGHGAEEVNEDGEKDGRIIDGRHCEKKRERGRRGR